MALWRVDRRIPILFFTLLTMALVGTILSILEIASNYGLSSSFLPFFGRATTESAQSLFVSVVRTTPIPLSLASWIAVAGVFFIWRGRTRSLWLKLGFDQDVFKLFVKMRGATTRLKLLQSLSTPKDRAQLAQDLGMDWKSG